jgi:hypothetical protein
MTYMGVAEKCGKQEAVPEKTTFNRGGDKQYI